jgi:hypothetical protein
MGNLFCEGAAPLPMLHGLEAPACEGMVVEVHLDIKQAPDRFLEGLRQCGFADDPFLDFYPPEYCFHYTGRTRATQSQLHKLLPGIQCLVEQIVHAARLAKIDMYAESELVREIKHFEEDGRRRDCRALEGIRLEKTRREQTAKADVHVEFRKGMVSAETRAVLTGHSFYWVSTPASDRFPAEEIATLQTADFQDALTIYKRLIAEPLPDCTGIHLEQKLAMVGSRPDLPMPQVYRLEKNPPNQMPGLSD